MILASAMNLKLLIAVTKIDLASRDYVDALSQSIERILTSGGMTASRILSDGDLVIYLKNQEQCCNWNSLNSEPIKSHAAKPITRIVPIIFVSSTTGAGVNLLKKLFFLIPPSDIASLCDSGNFESTDVVCNEVKPVNILILTHFDSAERVKFDRNGFLTDVSPISAMNMLNKSHDSECQDNSASQASSDNNVISERNWSLVVLGSVRAGTAHVGHQVRIHVKWIIYMLSNIEILLFTRFYMAPAILVVSV